MPKIEKLSWGKVKVDGQTYHQVLLVGDEVVERDKPKLENLFGTTHQIGEWERCQLLSGKPEIILIASGWSGLLKVSQKLKVESQKLGIELRTILTPRIVTEYNRLVGEGKRVNALIHTTC